MKEGGYRARLILLLLVLVSFGMHEPLLQPSLFAQDSATFYEYTDSDGQKHTSENYHDIPQAYRGFVRVRNRDGSSVAMPGLFSISIEQVLEICIFWLPILLFALLYATGKLDECYYRVIEAYKKKQGIEGLYRERRTQSHEDYLDLVFCLAGKLCRADGTVQRVEIDAIEGFIQERLRLSDSDSIKAKQAFRRGRDSKKSFREFLTELKDVFGNRQQLLDLCYSFLEIVANADGALPQEEEALLRQAREFLGVREGARSVTPGADMNLKEAYELLGATPYEEFSVVKKKYRKLIFELHPDRLHAQGMSSEFVQIAREKFLRVQAAFEKIEGERK